MRFFAYIDPKSAIHQQWRSGNRISGLLEGVLFRWNALKRVFEAAEVPDAKIDNFLVRQDKAVILEMLRVLPEEPQQDVLATHEQQLVKDPVEQQDAVATVAKQQQQVDHQAPAEPAQKPPPRRRVLPE